MEEAKLNAMAHIMTGTPIMTRHTIIKIVVIQNIPFVMNCTKAKTVATLWFLGSCKSAANHLSNLVASANRDENVTKTYLNMYNKIFSDLNCYFHLATSKLAIHILKS